MFYPVGFERGDAGSRARWLALRRRITGNKKADVRGRLLQQL
nr:MAG TPA: hypothetical protein [Caudoviricetes sp.]